MSNIRRDRSNVESRSDNSGRLSMLYKVKNNGPAIARMAIDALVYRKIVGNLEQMNIFRIFAEE